MSTEEPKKPKKPIPIGIVFAVAALILSVVTVEMSYINASNTVELAKQIDQLQTNMTQFSNFTKNQGTFNLQVINWATQTEQKIEFIANQTAKLQK